MFNSEQLQEKWSPLLNHSGLDEIKDPHRKAVTAVLLENQERFLREEREFLYEGTPGQLNEITNAANAAGASGGFSGSATAGGPVAGFDPVLISLIRRSMPNLLAYDICGVQPMNGPTGLIFAMRSRQTSQSGTETFFDEVDSTFSTQDKGQDLTAGFTDRNAGFGSTGPQQGTNPSVLGSGDVAQALYSVGQGMATGDSEALDGTGSNAFREMAFSIEKITVTAKSRALKAEYSLELAQDLKAIHGLDAETELANILSTEILAEINREVIRTINSQAKDGAQQANVTVNGVFNMSSDADGRWSAEKFKGLGVQIDRESNVIAKETRRGKGNLLICSSDVATALAAAGTLDYSPGISNNLNVDDTGNTFAGLLNGRIRVYIDPYANTDYCVVGYKGTNPFDAGVFYCPYVPLQMVKAVGEDTFQPRIGFKTRYGMASNPFVGSTPANGLASVKTNQYYRIFKVTNILT